MEENNATPYHKVVIPLCKVDLEIANSCVARVSKAGRNKRNSDHAILHTSLPTRVASARCLEQQNTNVMIWSCVIFFHRGLPSATAETIVHIVSLFVILHVPSFRSHVSFFPCVCELLYMSMIKGRHACH